MTFVLQNTFINRIDVQLKLYIKMKKLFENLSAEGIAKVLEYREYGLGAIALYLVYELVSTERKEVNTIYAYMLFVVIVLLIVCFADRFRNPKSQ